MILTILILACILVIMIIFMLLLLANVFRTCIVTNNMVNHQIKVFDEFNKDCTERFNIHNKDVTEIKELITSNKDVICDVNDIVSANSTLLNKLYNARFSRSKSVTKQTQKIDL